MKKKYNVLVLTDHTNHSEENSLYPFMRVMLGHSLTQKIDIASRGNKENISFFNKKPLSKLFVNQVKEDFQFTKNGYYLTKNLKEASYSNYDLIWLRLPPPLSKSFLYFIENTFKETIIINNPKGIYETGSKAFLMNFEKFCPPMKICLSKEDIITFKKKFPIVLKPLKGYGGRGIVKIENDEVLIGNDQLSFRNYISRLEIKDLPLLGVKYLKNVAEGDKRIVVVNGKVLGASLRLPPKNSWVCNVAMGGTSHITKVEKNEYQMIEQINPILGKMGIAMYGVDTLVGDKGERVLSEINTTSVGGLPQIASLKKLPLVEEAIDLIWRYFLKHSKLQ